MRQRLQDVFERAEWRQPSVVLLDDLDHLAGAPTSPEHEHGPEALLQQHVAQSKNLTFKLSLFFPSLMTISFFSDIFTSVTLSLQV